MCSVVAAVCLSCLGVSSSHAGEYAESAQWYGTSCISGDIIFSDDWSQAENVSYPGTKASIEVSFTEQNQLVGTYGEPVTCALDNLQATLLIDGVQQSSLPIILSGDSFLPLDFTATQPGEYSVLISGESTESGEYGGFDVTTATWAIKPPVVTPFTTTTNLFKVLAGVVPRPFSVTTYTCPRAISITTKRQISYSCTIAISDPDHVADSLSFYPTNASVLGGDYYQNPLKSSAANWKKTSTGWLATLKFTQQPVSPIQYLNLSVIEYVQWKIFIWDLVPSGDFLPAEDLYAGTTSLTYRK